MAGAEPPFELTVGEDDRGTRVDQLLAGPLGSRARAARLIDAGLVRLDGRVVVKRALVSPGQEVSVAAETIEIPEQSGVPARFEVVYEDAHLMVVDKPAGVVVHPGRGHRTGTLAQAVAGRAAGGEDPWRAGIVHRLDRDTSGLLVIAKSEAVHRALKELIATRALRREYLTLVDGVPPARSGTVDAPIGRSRRDRVLMSIDSEGPKQARTHFELIEAFADAALLRVVLDTGRTHQIRVHMAAIGHPVCGDTQYGGPLRYGLTRQFLHAARLAFVHPVTGAALDLRSELPDDLRAALRLAGG